MYYLRVFIVVLQELHCLLQCLPFFFDLFLARFVLIGCSVSYMHIYVPIVSYGLRIFILVLQEIQCLQYCLHDC